MMGWAFLALRLALAAALYLFLAWAFWQIWRDLQPAAAPAQTSPATPVWLRLLDASGVAVWQAQAGEAVIGRDPACEVCMDENTLSARHARLQFRHGHWWLDDLNSRNGTFLNEARVTEGQVVVPGDRLRCGTVIFQIDLVESSAEKGV